MGYAEILTRARARKGEAQGVLTYQKVTGIFDNPQLAFAKPSHGLVPRYLLLGIVNNTKCFEFQVFCLNGNQFAVFAFQQTNLEVG